MSTGSEASAGRLSQQTRPRALYTPALDFLLLGGASLIVLPLIALLPGSYSETVLYATFLLGFIVNYPHFAHSYQIFYRDFPAKIAGRNYPPHLQYRYMFSGIAVPVLMLAVMAICYLSGSRAAMGTLASAMAFFVGWHYVKQGYGLLIVDTVMQRSFYTDKEKKIFKFNAYAGWIAAFAVASYQIGGKDLLGFQYYFPPVPLSLVYAICAVAVTAAIGTAITAVQAARRTGRVPVNGYVAYITSVYIWLATVYSPAVYYVIPAFHSLQYLAVVWKYEYRREAGVLASEGGHGQADTLYVRFAIFIGLGMLLGAAGFVLVPNFLDAAAGNSPAAAPGPAFTYMIFIFINIHHYFLDNVMWRKDNPDVSRHLFSSPQAAK